MSPSTHASGDKRKLAKRRSRRRRLLLWILLFSTLGLAVLTLNGRLGGDPYLAQAQIRTTVTTSPRDSTPTTTPAVLNPTKTIPQASPTGTASQQPVQTDSTLNTPTQSSPAQVQASLFTDATIGTIFLSISEGGYSHLFAYNPQSLPLTRLTNGAWDDITPSASPDGTRLAFASNRNGQWDIYLMALESGEITQITDSPGYDGAPSWSPDNQWLVYESYVTLPSDVPQSTQSSGAASSGAVPTDNLDIYILQISASSEENTPLPLTVHPAAEYAPAWSPGGRQIAFVSNRGGEEEIWLADLDRIDDRFQNVSQNPRSADKNPAWSPDGNSLVWASTQDGYESIFIRDLSQPSNQKRLVGNGSQPVWSPRGNTLVTSLLTPNHTYLTGYQVNAPGISLSPFPLPGSLSGLTWGSGELPASLPLDMAEAAVLTPTPSWLVALTPAADMPGARQRVVPLENIEAPYPYIHDLVDESFNSLRENLAVKIGWDFLSTLENAFVPLTSPLFPGMIEDWLYTGRAFSLNPGPVNAGWMLVVREDYGASSYWRIYLRTRFQDGTQGLPLRTLPWNFNARYSGDPRYYEQGGTYAQSIPTGYWVDLTSLASDYGWERLPSLITWHSAMPASRFNEFVYADDLTWDSAMSELYPPSALYTPTHMAAPTLTPTKTRWPTSTPTSTRTPRASQIPKSTTTPTP